MESYQTHLEGAPSPQKVPLVPKEYLNKLAQTRLKKLGSTMKDDGLLQFAESSTSRLSLVRNGLRPQSGTGLRTSTSSRLHEETSGSEAELAVFHLGFVWSPAVGS